MDKTRKFKWFWAWEDEQEEAWLTDMAQQGWHLTEQGVFGFYTFERGTPRNVVYRLDYKTGDKDMADYLQLFEDAGWEHVGAMGGWQYFRKEAREGETPEIYTDAASKIKKYQRVLLFLVALLPVYSTMLYTLHDVESTFLKVASVLSSLLMVVYAYAMVRLFLRIQALKKQM
jgi:hypothetical protein